MGGGMTDDKARVAHLAEQIGGYLSSDMAPALASYYRRLIAEDVPHDLACMLVVRMQERMSGSTPAPG